MKSFYMILPLCGVLLAGQAGAQNGFNVQVLTQGAANPHAGTPAGYQHVIIRITANRQVPATGVGDWGSASFAMRVPKTLTPAPVANPNAASTQIINGSSSGFPELSMVSFISGSISDIRTFDGPTSGQSNDGYVYWMFQNNAAATGKSYNAGQSYNLVEFDVPNGWGCTNCMQITSASLTPPPSVLLANGLDPNGVMNLSESGVNRNQFNLQQNSQPLPVTLAAFNAEKASEARALITWQTAQEQQSARFELERSADGESFATVIARADARGSSTTTRSYQAYDNAPLSGDNFYRLKSVDKDGSFAYSSVKTLRFGAVKAGSYAISPNPATDQVNLTGMAGDETVRLIDMTGQVIRELKADGRTLTIPVQLLAPGIYSLQVLAGNEAVYNGRFVRK